ncbi:hypothetical protein GZH46_01155, partial [Fragariocoptes setiger]
MESPARKLLNLFISAIEGPADWVRENIVEPNRGEKYYWYHRKFPRVVPIDECYTDDYVCIYEANLEFLRNRRVETEILRILKSRVYDCIYWNKGKHGSGGVYYCQDLQDQYEKAELNYFIKYGDLSFAANVGHVFMKQKHRMIFERRKALKEQQEKAQEDNASDL